MQLDTISSLAGFINFSDATVANWTYGRRPPPAGFPAPIRVGRQLRYIREEVEAWLKERAAARPGQEQATQLKDTATASATPGRRRPGRPKKAVAAAGVTCG
jgi:predicted DNA-binding transcriptional regulator AlpA